MTTLRLIAWKAAKDWSGWHLTADGSRTICGRDVPTNGLKAEKQANERVTKICGPCINETAKYADAQVAAS